MKIVKAFLRRLGRILRWTYRLVLLLLIVDLIYLAVIWPDWARYAAGPVPKSRFIQAYEEQRPAHKDWPQLRWQPVRIEELPPALLRAVIVAEDSRFYHHSGFDIAAIREAVDYNIDKGRMARGASTISQQTAKNLFLTPSRSLIRKWHEMVLTWGLEQNLHKQRILEIYLNSAEFGLGIYGVHAAAQTYWGIPASQLSLTQVAELAATLPSPIKNNPAHRTPYFAKRSLRILNLLGRSYPIPDGEFAPEEAHSEPQSFPPAVHISSV
jgi:monofunctional glycosyltransferase